MSYIKVPGDIEKRSFEIIEEELGDKVKKFSESEMLIVKRIVHTSADFEYADLIEFQNNAIESGLKALEKGCKIYCDTNMIVNGLSKPALAKYNCSAYCLVSDKEVIEEAKKEGLTRSIVGMRKAGKDPETKVFILGNAPTALYQLKEMIENGEIEKPALVIGVPVGFVGAAESKEEFKKLGAENIYRFQETMIYISQNIVSQVFKYVFLATFFVFLTLIPGTYKLWKLSCYWIVPYILILWNQRFLNISHNIFWENNILEIIKYIFVWYGIKNLYVLIEKIGVKSNILKHGISMLLGLSYPMVVFVIGALASFEFIEVKEIRM